MTESELIAPLYCTKAEAPMYRAAPKLLAALEGAESFIAGFEGDETQEGIDDLLEETRAAIAEASVPDPAALRIAAIASASVVADRYQPCFHCSVCGGVFPNVGVLKLHMAEKHGGAS